jgi:choline dehydrogenase
MERGPDYVVVGGGSAGCVLANRLSQNPANRVLLLEAGGWPSRREAHVPAAWPKLIGSNMDWALETEPVPFLNSRRLRWPRGKALGGSSAINAMIHLRGFESDFASWHEGAGCPGWSWADVLPYYERSLLPAEVLRGVNPLSRVFCTAALEAGLGFTPDFNGEFRVGAGFFRVTQQGGRRAGLADLYLNPVRAERPNLDIATGAIAHRLLLEGQRVIGVEFSQDGKPVERVLANREVVLSAGAVHTPRILMSSGIGPADRLNSLGVRVVLDLPGVGENLQDHLMAAVTYKCRQAITLDTAGTLGNLLRYFTSHGGPLTSNIAEAGAFALPDSTGTPTIQLLFAPAFYMSHGAIQPGGPGFSIGATVLRPRSRGQILLRSVNPQDAPMIQPDYLLESADLEGAIDGLELARRIAHAAPFDRFRGDEVWPGAPVKNRNEWAGFVRRTAETLYHPAGTCAMGRDRMSVVNPATLCVYGIDGLRVADASVMPTLVSANPNATVVMIAEKAADMITGRATIENSYRIDKKNRMRNRMALA